MKTFFFIPARKNSKRLPNKNIMLFNGKPLLYYSIKYAQYCKADFIVVSTDCHLIAKIAEECGASVFMRSQDTSNDEASTASAAKECLEFYVKSGLRVDLFVTLQPTNPMRSSDLFSNCLELYNNCSQTVISVCQNNKKLGTLNSGIFIPSTYGLGQRSQDLKPLYFENGLIYLSNPNIVLRGELFSSSVLAYICDDIYGFSDIDEIIDFKIAEYLFQINKSIFSHIY
jgi:N-acylneuraminate cytidylyltransferase